MLNLPIGSLVAASYAACVAPKSLPSSAFLVLSPLLARYSRLSAFSMRMCMGEVSTDSSDPQAYKTSRSDSATHKSRPASGTGRLLQSPSFPSMESESLPKIFIRIAYPVEPFGFQLVQNDLSPPLLAGIDERLGKQPGLFDQVGDCQANELQCAHRLVSRCFLPHHTTELWIPDGV